MDEVIRQRIKRGQMQDEGCEVIDCTGVILCNDDIACEWNPPQHEPERPPFLCDWPKVESAR